MSGVFETMRAVRVEGGWQVPLWPLHLARLARAAAMLGAAAPSRAAATRCVLTALTSRRVDSVVRLVFEPDAAEPLRATVREFLPPASPLRLVLVPWPEGASRQLAGHKSTARESWERVETAARSSSGDEALVTDRDGSVLETSRGNLFVETATGIATPPDDGRILPGVARGLLLGGLRARGIPIAERRITRDELPGALRLWSSNAVHGPRIAVLVPGPPRHGAGQGLELLAALWSELLSTMPSESPLESGLADCR